MVINWWVLGIQTAAFLFSASLISWILGIYGWPVSYWNMVPMLIAILGSSIYHMNR